MTTTQQDNTTSNGWHDTTVDEWEDSYGKYEANVYLWLRREGYLVLHLHTYPEYLSATQKGVKKGWFVNQNKGTVIITVAGQKALDPMCARMIARMEGRVVS